MFNAGAQDLLTFALGSRLELELADPQSWFASP
jgi:hypothetical protein